MGFPGCFMDLTQNSLQEMLQRNKRPVVACGILVCLCIIGSVIYFKRDHAQSAHALELIEKYENDALKKYTDNKLSPSELEKKLQELVVSSDGHRFVFSILMKTARELSKNKEYSLALKVLSAGQERYAKKNPAIFYFISVDLAVLYEESGQLDKAVHILEKMDQSNVPILRDKIYLDLGRLYYKLGDKEKARLSLNRLLADSKENQWVNLGKIYLHLLDGR